MKPFHLLIEPGTPFVIPPYAIHLDGLLSYCIGSRWNVNDAGLVIERMKQVIEFDAELGVFKASAMTMVVSADVGVTVGSIQRADDLRNKLTRDLMDTKLKSIVVNGGPTKKRLTVRQTHYAPFVHFSGVGDAEAVRDLLLNHLPGIGADARTSAGGELQSIKIIEGQFTYAKNGKPLRNLPLSCGSQYGLQDPEPVGLIPPYYECTKVAGFTPDRVMIKTIKNFAE